MAANTQFHVINKEHIDPSPTVAQWGWGKRTAFRRNTNCSSSGLSSPNCWRCLFCLLDQSSVNFDFLFCPRSGFPFPIINIYNFSSSSLTDSCNFREAHRTLSWFSFSTSLGHCTYAYSLIKIEDRTKIVLITFLLFKKNTSIVTNVTKNLL